jgi:glycosyltransferase involved in cell wall biosynthesis
MLEAFGYQKPVVSTSIGAEGIDVVDGKHVLLADDSQTFADACCRLLQDPPFGRQLAEQAFNLVQSRYTYSRICPMVGEIIAAASLRAQ